jgi:ABC-type sugar transport system substrate-binding protein
MAAGAVRAMLDAGRPLVPVATGAGNGMIRIFLEYREAQPDFDIFLISEPTREAAETLKLIIKILKGEDYPKKISVEPLKITRENCEKYFKPFAPDAFEVDTTLTDEQLKKLFEK